MVNSTEGVPNSISRKVRKVSNGCDQRVHLWQRNNEYTTQTVFYLLTSFRHLFIIQIRIFNQYNLIRFSRASCLRMLFYAKWLLTWNKPYYGYVSWLDAHHHLIFLVMFLPRSWYGRERKMTTTGHPSQRPKSICSSAYFNTKFLYF